MDREKQRLQSSEEELYERAVALLQQDGRIEVLDDLFLARSTRPMRSGLALYRPALCLVVHGRKQVLVGKEVLTYDPLHYLLFTVELPVVFRVDEASPERPYFGVRLQLDPGLVADVMMEADGGTRKRH